MIIQKMVYHTIVEGIALYNSDVWDNFWQKGKKMAISWKMTAFGYKLLEEAVDQHAYSNIERGSTSTPVSYTHLDVYKRQECVRARVYVCVSVTM